MTCQTVDAPARAQLDPLLRAEDLVRLLQVDRRTVRRLCLKGQLPMPLKVGGSNRWRPDEVNAAIDRLSSQRAN
jgi:predicted DNA-binding transcriptional regulator AlpA